MGREPCMSRRMRWMEIAVWMMWRWVVVVVVDVPSVLLSVPGVPAGGRRRLVNNSTLLIDDGGSSSRTSSSSRSRGGKKRKGRGL
jgi:hypothetical protein